jgi:hypothetical protein
MHRVYKKMEMNVFFWPTAVKDKYWYKQDQILAIIPEPKKIKGSSEHFEIDPDIQKKCMVWKYFQMYQVKDVWFLSI